MGNHPPGILIPILYPTKKHLSQRTPQSQHHHCYITVAIARPLTNSPRVTLFWKITMETHIQYYEILRITNCVCVKGVDRVVIQRCVKGGLMQELYTTQETYCYHHVLNLNHSHLIKVLMRLMQVNRFHLWVNTLSPSR